MIMIWTGRFARSWDGPSPTKWTLPFSIELVLSADGISGSAVKVRCPTPSLSNSMRHSHDFL